MLVVVAEQVYPLEEVKVLVCSKHLGACEELAGAIPSEARRGRPRKTDRGSVIRAVSFLNRGSRINPI